MAFLTGTELRHREERTVSGSRRRVAVGCWYTAAGRSLPYIMKYQDDNGMIHTLKPLHVLSSEQKYYGGVLSRKYRCSVAGEGRLREFELLHCPEEGTWDLILNP